MTALGTTKASSPEVLKPLGEENSTRLQQGKYRSSAKKSLLINGLAGLLGPIVNMKLQAYTGKGQAALKVLLLEGATWLLLLLSKLVSRASEF